MKALSTLLPKEDAMALHRQTRLLLELASTLSRYGRTEEPD